MNLNFYDKIEYKDGVVYVCFGESTHLVTRKYFMARSGIRSNRTIDIIVKDTHLKLLD